MYSLIIHNIGNIYFNDYGRIRKITVSTGIITSIAGNGGTTLGDGGPATSGSLSTRGIALDSSGR